MLLKVHQSPTKMAPCYEVQLMEIDPVKIYSQPASEGWTTRTIFMVKRFLS